MIEINGERVRGISGEVVAQKLRGHVGTSVTVKVHNVSFVGRNGMVDSFPNDFIEICACSHL